MMHQSLLITAHQLPVNTNLAAKPKHGPTLAAKYLRRPNSAKDTRI